MERKMSEQNPQFGAAAHILDTLVVPAIDAQKTFGFIGQNLTTSKPLQVDLQVEFLDPSTQHKRPPIGGLLIRADNTAAVRAEFNAAVAQTVEEPASTVRERKNTGSYALFEPSHALRDQDRRPRQKQLVLVPIS
jgi:hypothetical protein